VENLGGDMKKLLLLLVMTGFFVGVAVGQAIEFPFCPCGEPLDSNGDCPNPICSTLPDPGGEAFCEYCLSADCDGWCMNHVISIVVDVACDIDEAIEDVTPDTGNAVIDDLGETLEDLVEDYLGVPIVEEIIEDWLAGDDDAAIMETCPFCGASYDPVETPPLSLCEHCGLPL
jgi:hypothetical protein